VLTYAHSGHELLTDTLSASRSVACTQATGLLPLCHSAVSTWRNVEQRGAAASPLARKSVRAMVNSMAAVVLSAAGASRWCETAYAGPVVAETFLDIFPEATFLCLHRCLPAVLADGVHAYPWGLGMSPFWPFSSGHPGSNIATICEYWIAHTEQLLAFEDAHPESCLRVRQEDLDSDLHRHAKEIFARLELDAGDLIQPGSQRENYQVGGGANGQSARFADHRPPQSQLTAQLLAKASELHARLDYGPLTL
jgi:hypothetical protein